MLYGMISRGHDGLSGGRAGGMSFSFSMSQ
jgi:hypothetical protein